MKAYSIVQPLKSEVLKMIEKANNEINGLTLSKNILKVFVIMMVFGLGVILGRWQSKEWSVIDKHKSLEENGYHYCPYCGEELKE